MKDDLYGVVAHPADAAMYAVYSVRHGYVLRASGGPCKYTLATAFGVAHTYNRSIEACEKAGGYNVRALQPV